MAAARQRKTRADYIAAIVVNVILLGILNTLPGWHLPFITDQFSTVLWAFNLSVGANIVANILFLIYDAAWFYHIAQIVLNGFGLLVVYTLYRVFPFAFGPLGNQIARLALLAGMLGLGIATLVEVVGLARAGAE